MNALHRKHGQLTTIALKRDDVLWLERMIGAHLQHHLRAMGPYRPAAEAMKALAREAYLQGLCDGAQFAQRGAIQP